MKLWKRISILGVLAALAISAANIVGNESSKIMNEKKVEPAININKIVEKQNKKTKLTKDLVLKKLIKNKKTAEDVGQKIELLDKRLKSMRNSNRYTTPYEILRFHDESIWDKNQEEINDILYGKFLFYYDEKLKDLKHSLINGIDYRIISKSLQSKIEGFAESIKETEEFINEIQKLLYEIKTIENLNIKEYDSKIIKLKKYLKTIIKTLEFFKEQYAYLSEEYGEFYDSNEVAQGDLMLIKQEN